MSAQRRWLTGALLAALSMAVAAADDAAARAALEQRLKLTASLLADGAGAQRILASGHARALSHLDQGKVHHALAQDLLAQGDLAGARQAADEALRHLGQARRLVPDAPGRQAAARLRFEQMLASLDRLVDAWRQRLGSPAAAEVDDGDLLVASALIQTSRAFGGEGRFEDAVHTLGAAEGHVLVGMNRVLHARTVDYTARAATPAEAFQLELQRHRSLVDLVPLAVSDLKPRAEAVTLIERYAQASRSLRDQAQARFAAGDADQALVHLRQALQFVQRALITAGLVVPQMAGDSP